MESGRIVVVGASAGGVRALQILAAGLPAGFPAPLLVVQHVGNYPSILPRLIARSGPLPAAHAADGEAIRPGHIHVAPPDHHMLVEDGRIRLSRGPKEQHARPAIDPLFRSAALAWRAQAIGVLLTGLLDDGTAGLQAIKRCGGIAVVQDPEDAEAPSMPSSALRYVEVDHSAPLDAIGALLTQLVSRAPAPVRAAGGAEREMRENEIMLGKGDFMEHLKSIGKPSTFVCPECDGALWEIEGSKPRSFRCHTGHAFSLRNLQHAQSEAADDALWSAFRALQEKEVLLRDLAESHAAADAAGEAQRLRDEAERTAQHARTLRALIEAVPSPPE